MINCKKAMYILLSVIAFVLAGCTASGTETAEKQDAGKDHLVLAVGGEPDDGFDPTTGWGRYGSPLFQSTLLSYDKDFELTYDLATSYHVSEDGLTWKLDIRENAKFSDGKPVTADDVVFTFKTAASSKSLIDLTNLEKVEKTDEYSIRFSLKEPQSTFAAVLATTGIVPKHAYHENYREDPVGSGPYQLVQWDKGQQLIVKKNPYYYGEEPFFNQLTFLFLSEDAAFAAAKTGEADVVSVPPAFAGQEIPGMKLIGLESVDNRGIMFPYRKEGNETEEGYPIGNNITADISIRKAINIAVDRRYLVDGVLEGHGTPAYTAADHLPWWNPDTVLEDGDVEQAADILTEAGWQKNQTGILEKDGQKASFTLLYPAGDQIRQSLSIAFADMIKPLGIDVQTEGKSWNELERLVHSYPVMMGWGSHDPLELYNLYSSETQGNGWYNANYYANESVDEYLHKAMTATSAEEANSYWKLAQWDGETGFSGKGDAPWAWLVNLKHFYYVKEGLEIGEQKVQPHGHGWPITDFITQWHWKE